MKPGTAKTLDAIINATLRGERDETHARRPYELGPEAVAGYPQVVVGSGDGSRCAASLRVRHETAS